MPSEISEHLMDIAKGDALRSQLVERRQRLRTFINQERKTTQLVNLLKGDEYSEARLSALVAREHHRMPEDLIHAGAQSGLNSIRNQEEKIFHLLRIQLRLR